MTVSLMYSTGGGRSGTFVAVDRLLQHIKSHDWVDVYNTVHEMLQHRCHMVQKEVREVKLLCAICHRAAIISNYTFATGSAV